MVWILQASGPTEPSPKRPRLAGKGSPATNTPAAQRGSIESFFGAQTPAAPTTAGALHPIGPSSNPLRPSGLVWLHARLRTHFLAVTGGSSGPRPAPKGQGEPMIAAAVRRPDPACPRRSSAAAVHLCMCRGAPQSEVIQSLALRWQSSASRRNLFASTSAGSAKVPAPHSPMLQPTGDAEGLVFHVPT